MVYEKRLQRDYRKYFAAEEIEVLELIDDLISKGIFEENKIMREIIEIVDNNLPKAKVFTDKHDRAAMEAFGRQQFSDLKSIAQFETKQPEFRFRSFINNWIDQNTGEKIQIIGQKTKKRILKKLRLAISEGFEEGEPTRTISKRIKEVYTSFKLNRSFVIARTEIGFATESANEAAAKATQLALDKGWITANDGRERDTHAEADGQTVDVNDFYIVGGAKLDHPLDPKGPAKEIIQCRCTQEFIPKEN